MNSVILFDIDGTLLNTKKLSDKYIFPTLSNFYGLPLAEFNEVSQGYWGTIDKPTLFNPDDYFNFLVSKLGKSSEALRPLFFNAEFFRNSIYEDVIPMLTQLQAKDYTLGIFSEGQAHFQITKLKLTELSVFFDPDLLFISDSKTTPEFLDSLPTDSLIVDDKSEVVILLSKHPRCQPIWLNRQTLEKYQAVKTIHTLSDIFDII